MLMLQPNRTKIFTLNTNTKEIVTLDSCYGQSDTLNANIKEVSLHVGHSVLL